MMFCRLPSRPLLAAASLAATANFAFSATAYARSAPLPQQPTYQGQRSAPEPQGRAESRPNSTSRSNPGNRISPQGDHLAQWMSQHQNLPLAQQQRALAQEPGFRNLPAETQQRMRNRLSELNTMSPERRQHLLNRTEAMERLAPEQRQEVRSAMQGLASLPENRRRLVARAFRDLRSFPPQQRQYAFSSDPRYTTAFSPPERAALGNLLSVEPYLPPPQPRQAQPRQAQPQTPYPDPAIPYSSQPPPYR